MSQEALADDGPMAGKPNLKVEAPDGVWQETVLWTDDKGQRHQYRLKERSLSLTEALPVYAYVRTLDSSE